MKTFKVPEFYRSPIISAVKNFFKIQDPRKKDMRPAHLSFGKVNYYIARHFGFCYGVENAIEIAFKALEENPGKNIYLLSQMIHNPDVNRDLTERGVRFLQDTLGNVLIPFNTLSKNDIVIIPAFGAPLPLLAMLEKKGIQTHAYNTTCPFVERVWKKSEQIGKDSHTIIIHGKYNHEETRSTFSRSITHSNGVVIVKDMKETALLAEFIMGKKDQSEFESLFKDKFSAGFDILKHFQKIGVINQTTMLATETEEIAGFIKSTLELKYGKENIKEHFADTRDTLCYATNENQNATLGLLDTDADLALIIGGYNSSNTSHLVELCERKFPTYFISSANEIIDENEISHYNIHTKELIKSKNFLPKKNDLKIVISSGASCPDSLLENVIRRINHLMRVEIGPEEAVSNIKLYQNQ